MDAADAEIREIRIEMITPNYRLVCEEEVILSLCADISHRGLQEPLVAELFGHRFRIVDGEKRWRACKRIGMARVRVRIVEASTTEPGR